MRLPITIFLLFFLGPLLSLGQISTSLARRIVSADTVLLVTHGQTEGAVIRDETTGKYKNADTVVVGGRPNFKVITESKLIPLLHGNNLFPYYEGRFRTKP